MEKNVLGLVLPTDPRWVNIAEMNIREVLIDHAYCEQKAASSCISLIVKYPDKGTLVEKLTPVVAEEWSHFEQVLQKLRERGWTLGPLRKDEYVELIGNLFHKGGSRDDQLIEKLLMHALIEARSCERFRLLSKEIKDADLASFYYDLMVSEAGHYKMFLMLAREFQSREKIDKRWREILAGEGAVVEKLAVRGDRMH